MTDAQRRQLVQQKYNADVVPFLSLSARRMAPLRDPSTISWKDPGGKSHEPRDGTTDNSNTQFAMFAVWAARRHGMPVDRTLELVAQRFRSSQNSDGGWDYYYKYGGSKDQRPAMTCVGLLGLAFGHGLDYEAELRDHWQYPEGYLKMRQFMPVHGLVSTTFASAPSGPLHVVPWLPFKPAQLPDLKNAPNPKKTLDDDSMKKGFAKLAHDIDKPSGRTTDLHQGNLYFLWSVERVGVMYNRRLIQDKDWYGWGAEKLVANQKNDGSWGNSDYWGHTTTSDTCLALLFLKRVNLAEDLTHKVADEPPAHLPTMILSDLPKSPAPAPPKPPPPEPIPPVAVASPKPMPEAVPIPSHGASLNPVDIFEKPDNATLDQGDLHPVAVAKKGTPWWVWLLVALAVLALLVLVGTGAYMAYRFSHTKPVKKKRKRRRRPAVSRMTESSPLQEATQAAEDEITETPPA